MRNCYANSSRKTPVVLLVQTLIFTVFNIFKEVISYSYPTLGKIVACSAGNNSWL